MIGKRRAFLDLILVEAQKGTEEFSHLDIRNEVDTFMFEGHDTTAAAMTWFLYCMGTNPKHQELVREELDQVFGDSDRSCTMNDAAQLKYLELCIKEALRLYPSVPGIERQIGEDVQLGDYKFVAGTTILILIYALHRHEDYFPDPLAFKPERFLNDTGKHPYAFVPFSAGPRNCIGQKFALLEEKVILSSLLRRFRFTYDLAKHGPAKPCTSLILKPLNGMPLLITHR